MRGQHYSSDDGLPEQDLLELADALAMQLHQQLGQKVYLLSRRDVAELVERYIDDLSEGDRRAMPWLVWDLFQEAAGLG